MTEGPDRRMMAFFAKKRVVIWYTSILMETHHLADGATHIHHQVPAKNPVAISDEKIAVFYREARRMVNGVRGYVAALEYKLTAIKAIAL